MTPNEILNISITATKDEVKAAYRKLCLKIHPDINKAPDATIRFRELNKAYEFLMSAPDPKPESKKDKPWGVYSDQKYPSNEPKPQEHFKETPNKPKPVHNPFTGDHYYRIVEKNFNGTLSITIPERVIYKDTLIHCMYGMEEFNINLKKGTQLPLHINITNLRNPIKLSITTNWGF